MDDLDILIKNLQDITTGKIWKRKDIKLQIYRCYKTVLYEIAKLQVADTSYARALIVKVFCDKFGLDTIDIADLNENHQFWEKNGFPENSNKSWDSAVEGDGVSITAIGENINLSFDTPEVTNQALGKTKFDYKMQVERYISPSPYNPHIEPQMIAHHFEAVIDKVNGGDVGILKTALENLCDDIADYIIKGLK